VFEKTSLDLELADQILALGIRRFGSQFFRPACLNCNACIPLRVEVQNFSPSASQKRLLNKNHECQFSVEPSRYDPSYFELYLRHNRRFKQLDNSLNEESFHKIHFQELTDNSLVSRVHHRGELLAFGLLEVGLESVSSQYFVFDPAWSKLSLGTWGALQEIHWARQNGYLWYYLGYWISQNPSMDYKKNFRPHQLFDWEQKQWQSPSP
jgi:leucyl-tRNA---protein transferase